MSDSPHGWVPGKCAGMFGASPAFALDPCRSVFASPPSREIRSCRAAEAVVVARWPISAGRTGGVPSTDYTRSLIPMVGRQPAKVGSR